MVEMIESLRQREGITSHDRRLERSDRGIDSIIESGKKDQELPVIVQSLFQEGEIDRMRGAGDRGRVESLALRHLVEDIVGAYDRVEQIRPGLSFETQRLVEVERDDLVACVFDHEVA